MSANLQTNLNQYSLSNVPALQYVGGGGNCVGGGFNYGASSCYQEWLIKDAGKNLPRFIADVMGYAKKAGTGIHRSLPARHPELVWCWASNISWDAGLAPTGQRQGFNRATAAYKGLKLKVEFSAPPYAIIPDGQITAARPEYHRFVSLNSDPNTEFIQRKHGTFQFPAGTPAISTQELPEGVPQLLVKNRIALTWHQVPDDGLFTNGGSFREGATAANLIAGIGKVNSSTFLGYPAGTLLMEGYKLIPYNLPIMPSILGNEMFVGPGGKGGIPPRFWNVEMVLTYFNPPIDTGGGFTARGHNLLPHPTDPYWYRVHQATTGATDTSPYWRYQEIDYATMFLMN